MDFGEVESVDVYGSGVVVDLRHFGAKTEKKEGRQNRVVTPWQNRE